MGSVELYREGRVARLVFDNRPHNSITTEMFVQLGEHVAALDADPGIGAVVIHGAGTHLYTVGADIGEMEVRGQLPDRAAATREWLEPINAVLHAIECSPKVYICAMKGISFGGGLETAAACDIRVAADNA
ncbi:MAG: enoyl-CoA hydratase/isomerase family protein, partial [Ktedonobacterales bacterium]